MSQQTKLITLLVVTYAWYILGTLFINPKAVLIGLTVLHFYVSYLLYCYFKKRGSKSELTTPKEK